MSKRNRVERIPRWLRERKPPPHPLAFRQFVERIPPVTCCPVHREGHRRLLVAVRAPAGRCLLCGAQGTWRARWPLPATPAPVPTPCCLHATEEELGLYYDLCDRCQQRPHAPAQVDALMRQRPQALWHCRRAWSTTTCCMCAAGTAAAAIWSSWAPCPRAPSVAPSAGVLWGSGMYVCRPGLRPCRVSVQRTSCNGPFAWRGVGQYPPQLNWRNCNSVVHNNVLDLAWSPQILLPEYPDW